MARRSANRTKPRLWQRIVAEVTRGSKGGRPGQWSARKAQLAVQRYKDAGGGYVGRKKPSLGLVRWTKQRWRTKSGKPSLATGERYLPAKAIEALSPQEYAATSRAKRRSLRSGKQFSRQPASIARKVKPFRRNGSALVVVQIFAAAAAYEVLRRLLGLPMR